MVKTRTTAAVESAAAGGASTEAPRRSEPLMQGRKRSRHASPPSPAAAPARRRQASKRSRAPSKGKHDDGEAIVGSSVDDAESELSSVELLYLTPEEILEYCKRLHKKRANMGLAWYNTNNPEDSYEFTSMSLKDVYNFMDGGVCYMHMNFKATNVTKRSEELFFAELAVTNNVFDANGGYSTTACSIVDDNCVGGKKDLRLKDGLPAERYDEKNCYACAEKIKHPAGMTYKGGHYAEDYLVGCDSE